MKRDTLSRFLLTKLVTRGVGDIEEMKVESENVVRGKELSENVVDRVDYIRKAIIFNPKNYNYGCARWRSKTRDSCRPFHQENVKGWSVEIQRNALW